MLILSFLLPAAGCFPKCLPTPQPVAVVKQTAKLPVRISGITYIIEPHGEKLSEQNSETWLMRLTTGLSKISTNCLLDPAITSKDTDRVVSVRIRVHEVVAGFQGSIFASGFPARYAATYEAYSPEDGTIYLSRKYDMKKDFEQQDDRSCTENSEGIGALYEAINDVTGQFIDELYKVQGQAAVPSPGRLPGSLGKVTTFFPVTKRNIRWMLNCATNPYAHATYSKLDFDLPGEVTERIQKKAVFDHTGSDVYDIKIFMPAFYATDGGWFSDPFFEFNADAVIYKNGTEIADVEFEADSHKGQTLQEVMDSYTQRILEELKKLQEK
ncbi:hypothetical protein [Pseudodesulfovibrio sp.]|uniref:hypothetical protein n=1 Tax=unclassified Pseudodesulfovibrio TaxID=2661612 RepID=UPI003B00C52C